MPSSAREALANKYEQLWAEASLVGPQPVADEQADEGEQEDEGDEGGDDEQEPSNCDILA